MSEQRSLLLVGKVRPERKRSLTGMAAAADLALVALEEPAQALEWLESNDPGCLIVDANVGRLDKLIAKLRSKRLVSHVPVLALVSAPDDLWIEQYFSWGGDDVVHVDAGSTLLDRLRAVPREPPHPSPNRSVVIADPDKARTDVIGRNFAQAGFQVKSAIERKALEFFVQQHPPEVVIANCILGELPELIVRTRQAGSTATWIVLAARRELEAQQLALSAIERCAVMGVQVSPWQILGRANELRSRRDDERRSEPRRPFGSFVLFRAAGSDDDDVGVAFNLSSRGMFIRTFAPVLSDDVWLEWRVPQDKTRVRLEGRVVWRQLSLTDPGRAPSPMGFGIAFCDYLGAARKHLERALEVLDGGARRSSGSSVAPGPQESDAARPKDTPAILSAARASLASAAATKSVAPKTVSSLPPAALAASGTARTATSVRPLTNLGGPGKPAVASKPEINAKPEVTAKPEIPARAPVQAPLPVKDKPAALGAVERSALATSQVATKRIASPAPLAQPGIRPPAVANVKTPPRPVGAPPRPDRGAAVEPPCVAGATAPELKERRFDTLRNDQAFEDAVETTDPDAHRELLEEGPNSSEATEILMNPAGLFEAGEEQKHPLFTATDDAPTAVVQRPLDADLADPTVRNPPVGGPPSARGAEPFFAVEEQVTRQWQTDARAGESLEIDDELLKPRHRRGTPVIVGGVVLVAAVLAGVGLWLRAAGNSRPQPAPAAPKSLPTIVAAGADQQLPPTPSAAVTAPAAADAAPAEASASASTDGIPWAKADDGNGLEAYPPVEDPQGGKGRLLADRYGYLVVRFPEAAYLFANNIAVGATNWKIAFPCGEKVLRVGVGERPVIWLSQETRINVECRGLTRVVFERLSGVVVPPGTQRPIAPGSVLPRKPTDKPTDSATELRTEQKPAESEKAQAAPVEPATKPVPKAEPKPAEGERGIVDTRE